MLRDILNVVEVLPMKPAIVDVVDPGKAQQQLAKKTWLDKPKKDGKWKRI
jgi:hypothetical protein